MKERTIDLHVHTKEGSNEGVSVATVLKRAKAAGLSAIAITDHDSVEAVSRAQKIGKKKGIQVIAGVELDATYGTIPVHIVSYFAPFNNPTFVNELSELFEKPRADRINEMVYNLVEKRLISDNDSHRVLISLAANTGALTRQCLANAVVESVSASRSQLASEVRTFRDKHGAQNLGDFVLHEFLSKKSPSKKNCYAPYRPEKYLNVKKTVEFCLRHGMPSGFAHIAKDIPDKAVMIAAIEEGVTAGMVLLTTNHPKHSEEDVRILEGICRDQQITLPYAKRKNLIPIKVSDYHADNPAGYGELGMYGDTMDTLTSLRSCAKKIKTSRKMQSEESGRREAISFRRIKTKSGARRIYLPKLALFDTDQTLVNITPLHDAAYKYAMKHHFRVSASMTRDLEKEEYAGRSTHEIMRKLIKKKTKYDDFAIDTMIVDVMGTYTGELRRQIGDIDPEAIVCPGVLALLTALKRRGVCMAAYTGGTDEVNKLTLESAELVDFFPVRVTMDMSGVPNREQAIRKAIDESKRHYGQRFALKDIVNFGDSIFDIESGKRYRIRTVVVSGTSSYTRSHLKAMEPFRIYETLGNTNRVLKESFGLL